MRYFVMALALLSLGCNRATEDGSPQTNSVEIIQLDGDMKLERPENQIGVRSALPVLTEQKVKIQLTDYTFGNASDIQISARDKTWSIRLSGNKSVTSKPFTVTSISDNQEIQIIGTRTEKPLGQKTEVKALVCQKRIEMYSSCNHGRPGCYNMPRTVGGQISQTTTLNEIEVKYDFELSDKDGKIATISAEPKVITRVAKVDKSTCR